MSGIPNNVTFIQKDVEANRLLIVKFDFTFLLLLISFSFFFFSFSAERFSCIRPLSNLSSHLILSYTWLEVEEDTIEL